MGVVVAENYRCAHVIGGHPKYHRFGQRCSRRGAVGIFGLWFCATHAKKAVATFNRIGIQRGSGTESSTAERADVRAGARARK